MGLAGFISAVVLNGSIAGVVLIIYAILRRLDSQSHVYFPKQKEAGEDTKRAQKQSLLKWAEEMLRTDEEEVRKTMGLDGVSFIRMFRFGVEFFIFATIICIGIIIPVNVTDEGVEITNRELTTPPPPPLFVEPDNCTCACFDEICPAPESNSTKNSTAEVILLDDFDKLSMSNIRKDSERLWAHFFCTWLLTLAAFYLLHKYYKLYVADRLKERCDPNAAVESYSIYVTDMPKEILAKSDDTDGELAAYFRSLYGNKYVDSVACRNYAALVKLVGKLRVMEAKLEKAQWVLENKKETPQHKTKALGLCGPKVDSIPYWEEEITKMKGKIAEEYVVVVGEKKKTPAGFVTFSARATASVAAQTIHNADVYSWRTDVAPEPRDVHWPNVHLRYLERTTRMKMGAVFLFLLVIFFMVPIAFIAGLSTLDNLRKAMPFIDTILINDTVKGIVEGILPTLALLIFMAFLPAICVALAKVDGYPSLSTIDRAAFSKLYWFVAVNIWFGQIAGGSILNKIEEITENVSDLPRILGQAIPTTATFFIDFTLLKTLGVLPMEGFVYSVINPIITPLTLLHFVLGLIVWKNQLLRVYTNVYNGGGALWPMIHKRILVSLLLMQLTMCGLFFIKYTSQPIAGILTIPQFPLTLIFHLWTKERFEDTDGYIPLDVAKLLDDDGTEPAGKLVAAYQPDFMKEAENYKPVPVDEVKEVP
eukprot:jgi/Mesvir1/829/Mv17411-RA.3